MSRVEEEEDRNPVEGLVPNQRWHHLGAGPPDSLFRGAEVEAMQKLVWDQDHPPVPDLPDGGVALLWDPFEIHHLPYRKDFSDLYADDNRFLVSPSPPRGGEG